MATEKKEIPAGDIDRMTEEWLKEERERVSGILWNTRVLVKVSGECTLVGYDQKPGSLVKLTRQGVMVVHWPGQSYWRGIGGDRGYQKARYAVYRVKFVGKDKVGRRLVYVDPMIEFASDERAQIGMAAGEED